MSWGPSPTGGWDAATVLRRVGRINGVSMAGSRGWRSGSSMDLLRRCKFSIRLRELGVFTWRGEGSRETSEPLPEPKGAPGKLERDLGQGMEGQDNVEWLPTARGEGWM